MKLSALSLRLFAISTALLLGSCQSMSEGLLTFEGRALILDDAEIEAFQAGTSFTEADADLQGYGVHVALMTPIFDVLGGVDWREYEDADTPELVLGLRRRILELWRLHPYIEGNLRYGTDLDTQFVAEDYTGWAVGVGAIVDLTSSLFLNVRVMYEKTPVETALGGVDIDGLVGTLGIGLAL